MWYCHPNYSSYISNVFGLHKKVTNILYFLQSELKVCGVVILTTVDIFKLEFIYIRFTTFFTSTKISNTKKHQISAYRRFENVSLLYIYCQWVAATTLRTKFPLITSKKCASDLCHVMRHYKIDALRMFFLRLWKFERLMNRNFDRKW